MSTSVPRSFSGPPGRSLEVKSAPRGHETGLRPWSTALDWTRHLDQWPLRRARRSGADAARRRRRDQEADQQERQVGEHGEHAEHRQDHEQRRRQTAASESTRARTLARVRGRGPGRSRKTGWSSARVRAAQTWSSRSACSSAVMPALGVVLAQGRRRLLALGVADPQLLVTHRSGRPRPRRPLVAVGEQAVEAAPGVGEDLGRRRALLVAAGRHDLPDRAHHLADLGLEVGEGVALASPAPPRTAPRRRRARRRARRRTSRPVVVSRRLRRPRVSSVSTQALVLELRDGRVDRAGARAPGAVAALGDLLDDLVAVDLRARSTARCAPRRGSRSGRRRGGPAARAAGRPGRGRRGRRPTAAGRGCPVGRSHPAPSAPRARAPPPPPRRPPCCRRSWSPYCAHCRLNPGCPMSELLLCVSWCVRRSRARQSRTVVNCRDIS